MATGHEEEDERELDAHDAVERRTLRWVFGINLVQAVAGGLVGFLVDSAGLMGAALDNLADGAVYGVSLYAVGRTLAAKAWAARLSGVLLIVLALGLLAEVVRRFLTGAEPIGVAMIVTAAANAAVNVLCLRLLRAHREDGVHLKASWIFTSNDMLANVGIAVSGGAVMFFDSPVPDLVVGLVVVAIAVRGGIEILERAKLAREERDEQSASGRQ